MAKFDPCAVLPNPNSQQAIVKSVNRFGCFYKQKSAWRDKHPGPRLRCQFGVTLFRYGANNWLKHRRIAYRWTHVLSASQRLAWDTLASLMAYRNYYGDTGYPNGWSLYYKTNRIYLWQAGGFKDNPPGAWDALQVPPILSWELFGVDLVLKYAVDFNPPPALSGGAVISRDPMPGSGKFPQHYWTPNQMTWGFNGVNWISDVYLDCPFFSAGQASRCTVGVFHVDTDTAMFTDFKWIRLP